jgi:hypothetical protein
MVAELVALDLVAIEHVAVVAQLDLDALAGCGGCGPGGRRGGGHRARRR